VKPIQVYYTDSFDYVTDLSPDITAAAQRLVTEEEYTRIHILLAEYDKLQALLKEIQARPEYDPFE
jgi:hypothetical protein